MPRPCAIIFRISNMHRVGLVPVGTMLQFSVGKWVDSFVLVLSPTCGPKNARYLGFNEIEIYISSEDDEGVRVKEISTWSDNTPTEYSYDRR